jgi:hypothetical protein
VSKYPNALAEELHGTTPDEEYGSSSEGIGWAGLYIAETDAERNAFGAPFVVLVEGTDGFVDLYRAQTMSQARGIAEQYAD